MSKCRVCLCTKPRKDIAELCIFENGERLSYKDIIMFCLEIQINEDSNLSTKLCVKCYRKIIQFYQFKVLALKNDEHMRSSVLENKVFWIKEDVKIEKETENIITNLDELIQVKNEDHFDFDAQANEDDNSTNINYEFKEEIQSDDEFLSVIRNLKSQSDSQSVLEEAKENAPIRRKKRYKIKDLKKLSLQGIKEKKRRNKGVYEGICEHCGKTYKDLRAHVRLQHLQKHKKIVNCEHCDKVFSNNILKRRHVQRKHLAVKQKCHLCERSVADLKLHIRTIHEKDSLQFQCPHCILKFVTRSRLNSHVIVHTKDRPFKCDLCDSSFRQKICLDNHKRQVHNKERSHLCQFCSKSFFKKYHLAVHLRSHTNEKPYKCPDCGKYYQSSTSLKNHRLTHSTEKTVNCSLCDASFVSKSYLANHLMSHRKEKRYPCQYCHVKFHRSDHRKRHEYTAHLKFTGNVVDVPRSYTPKKRSKNSNAPATKSFENVCEDSTVSSANSL